MSNRYFILNGSKDKYEVIVYTDPAQAAYDFIRIGGLVCPDIVLTQECEVALQLNRQTMEYKKGGRHEDIAESQPTKS